MTHKLFIILIIISLSIWTIGLAVFYRHMVQFSVVSQGHPRVAVALTGGAGRIKEALSLLENNIIKTLFVSGAGDGVRVEDILKENGYDTSKQKEWFTNIELGYWAKSTKQNAEETAKWVKKNNYKNIMVITANYHMPRAIAELKHVLPNVNLIAHPVSPDNFGSNNWLDNIDNIRFFISEYHKLIWVIVRNKLKHFV